MERILLMFSYIPEKIRRSRLTCLKQKRKRFLVINSYVHHLGNRTVAQAAPQAGGRPAADSPGSPPLPALDSRPPRASSLFSLDPSTRGARSRSRSRRPPKAQRGRTALGLGS